MKCANILLCVLILTIIIIYLFPVITNENFDSVVDMSKNKYDPNTESIQSGTFFIPQPVYISAQGEVVSLTGDSSLGIKSVDEVPTNDGIGGDICSKSCCDTQWPLPFKIEVEPNVCSSKQEYYPSTYSCNDSVNDVGCLCMTKKQKDLLVNRGQP